MSQVQWLLKSLCVPFLCSRSDIDHNIAFLSIPDIKQCLTGSQIRFLNQLTIHRWSTRFLSACSSAGWKWKLQVNKHSRVFFHTGLKCRNSSWIYIKCNLKCIRSKCLWQNKVRTIRHVQQSSWLLLCYSNCFCSLFWERPDRAVITNGQPFNKKHPS